ncbi:MAG TPA: lipid asymmetry maintenance ABC transporter permease subunit MlaE [Steroidobacteraceae bacterium]|nr:lipid asymmetry maintenance ABC transporter permease subunit MlaE [Steroidobacteraceae bacterium]
MSTVAQNGHVTRALGTLGAVAIFFGRLVMQGGRVWARPGLVVAQIHNAGGRSVVIIMLSGLFTGMVLALLGFNLLQRFGSEEALGFAAALAMVKELGPVLTALLFAGRAGTALTSEIGLMRATDQLTAMEMMAVDPMGYIAAPRFFGGVISMPLLTAVFDVVGLFGAWLVGVRMMGVDNGSFWSQMQSSVNLHDVSEGIAKSVVFGITGSLIAVYEGYHSEPTAEGVGLATTRTVVASSVLVLLLDYMLTAAFL